MVDMTMLFEVHTFIEQLYCRKCDSQVELKFVEVISFTYPPRYKYKCSKCGILVVSNHQYPVVTYKKIT